VEVAGWARAAGVSVALHNMTAGSEAAGDRGIASLPGRETEFRAGVAAALDYALAVNCRRLNCLAGIRQPALPPGAQFAVLVANLQYAADQLQRHGLTLLLEPIALIPDFFIADSRAALAVMDAAGRANLRLQYDFFQMHLAGENLAANLRALLPRIGHLQLADAPGRHEPGTGQIDYAALLPLIDALGYQGAVGCEYTPLAGTIAGLDWARNWLQPKAGSTT
jgi:hydroxypyruvate isomerase